MDDLELLGKACEEYAQYLLFPQLWTDGGSQYVVQREAAIEKILARLDEFAAFAQTVKLESAKSRTLLPALVENAKKLQYVYDLIDALVAFVARMSQNVSLLEERTNQVANSPQFKPAILAAFASLPSPLRSSFQQPTPATSGPVSHRLYASCC